MTYQNTKDLIKTEFDLEELPGLGWIRVTEHGHDNIYFEYKTNTGHICQGFAKVLEHPVTAFFKRVKQLTS